MRLSFSFFPGVRFNFSLKTAKKYQKSNFLKIDQAGNVNMNPDAKIK